MSVIVMGMDVPKSCYSCDLARFLSAKEPYCIRTMKVVVGSLGKRPDWCPLRPIPEKHGRLIDGDALQSSFRESVSCCKEWIKEAEESDDSNMILIARQSYNTFVETAMRAKGMETIVEAEED